MFGVAAAFFGWLGLAVVALTNSHRHDPRKAPSLPIPPRASTRNAQPRFPSGGLFRTLASPKRPREIARTGLAFRQDGRATIVPDGP